MLIHNNQFVQQTAKPDLCVLFLGCKRIILSQGNFKVKYHCSVKGQNIAHIKI